MNEMVKCTMCGGDMEPNSIGEHYSWGDCVDELKRQLSAVTAERDRALQRVAKADEALIGMVEQYLHWGNREDGTPFYHHVFMSAGENAFDYLEENGLAKVNGEEELEFVKESTNGN